MVGHEDTEESSGSERNVPSQLLGCWYHHSTGLAEERPSEKVSGSRVDTRQRRVADSTDGLARVLGAATFLAMVCKRCVGWAAEDRIGMMKVEGEGEKAVPERRCEVVLLKSGY